MLKSVLCAAALAGLLAAPVLADEITLEANGDGQIVFTMPSGNIGCIYTPEGGTDIYEPEDGGPELSCDRIEPSYVNVTLGAQGKARRTNNPGEQGCCSLDQVFEYENEALFDGFVCYSAVTGLTCETDDAEHGFLISKAKIQVW